MKELMISCVVLLFAITYSHAGPFDPAAGLVVLQISQGQNDSYDSDHAEKEDGILLVNGPVGAGGGDEVVSP